MPVTRKIFLDRADRLQRMPVESVSDLDRIAARLRRLGVGLIDLSRATATSPPVTLPFDLGERDDDWRPAPDEEMVRLAEAVSGWYERRFGVHLDPQHELAIVPNSVMGLSLLALAFVDSGDMALLPDPGAPFYRGAIALCGAGVMPYYLLERNDFLPSFAGLEAALAGRTRLMVISYPHNPTAAMADLPVLTQAVGFARRQRVFIVYDAALTHAFHGPVRPHGFLEVAGSRGVGVEIFPIGTSFGVDDLSLAVVAGNREAVSAVTFLMQASHLRPLTRTVRLAVSVLDHGESLMASRMQQLEEPRRILAEAFGEAGWMPRTSPVAPFLWASVPAVVGTEGFCRRLLRRTGVRLSPGTIFGSRGEGYARVAIPPSADVARTVAERLCTHGHLYQRRIPRRNRLSRRRASPRPADEAAD